MCSSFYHINLKDTAGQVDHTTNQLDEVKSAEERFRLLEVAT